MARIQILRTDKAMPAQAALDGASALLFGAIDGFTKEDRRAWRRFWKRVKGMEPGELATCEMVFPRSGKFHRLHMALEQTVFDSQERFIHFEQLRNWMKIGAGHVDWMPGPRGAVVPIPKSIAYSAMDDEEFKVFHNNLLAFLREPHAAKVLWPHLTEQARAEMVEALLADFEN